MSRNSRGFVTKCELVLALPALGLYGLAFEDACLWMAIIVPSSSPTSRKPSALNQAAFSQLNPSPKVLSGAVMYQWQSTSGVSTEHWDQSGCHCGTWTHITAAKTSENKAFSMRHLRRG